MEPEFEKLVAATIKGLRDCCDMRGYTQTYMRKVALEVLAHVYEAVEGKLPDPGNNLPVIFED